MTLVYNPGIDISGEPYYSFPQPISVWHVEEESIYTEHIVPDSEGAVITGFQRGPLRIRVEGIIIGNSADVVLTTLNDLREKLKGTKFDLYRYRGGAAEEYYKGVYCEGFAYDRTHRPLTHLPWLAEFVAADPTVYTS